MAAAAVPALLPYRRTCPRLKPSSGGQQFPNRSLSVGNNALHLDLLCVSRLSSSSFGSHSHCRKELRHCLLPLCQHSCLPTAQPSESKSCSTVLNSQNAADLHSSAPQSQVPISRGTLKNGDGIDMYALGGLGVLLACALQCPEASVAATESSLPSVLFHTGAEPANALSLPTWIIHVASVIEWVSAMALVWKYGDAEGKSTWKGLTWGMVPLLGGAMCACSWHFYNNAESLEGLVVLQGFLTVMGNCTMWAAAYRIWKSSQEKVTAD